MKKDLVNIADFKSHLSDYITKVNASGDYVIIGRYGKPVAKLVPFSPDGDEAYRTLGFAKHLVSCDVKTVQQQVDTPFDEDVLEAFYS